MRKKIIFTFILIFLIPSVNSFAEAIFFYQNQIKTEAVNLSVSETSTSSVTLNYKIQGEGITEIGLCYGTSPNPTVSDLQTIIEYQDDAIDVSGYVGYDTQIDEIEPEKVYYARAYVKNNAGKIFYSNEVKFTAAEEDEYTAMNSGPRKDFYADGKLMRDYNLKNGLMEGKCVMYDDSGKISALQYYKNGLLDGHCMYYSNGKLSGEVNMKDGVQNGEGKEYYPNGAIKSISNITGTPPDLISIHQDYYENGRLGGEVSFSGDKFQYSKSWDEKGRITCERTPGSWIEYEYDADGHKHSYRRM